MSKSWQIPRRTFLKGLGTAIALPWLEAMSPLASGLASDLAGGPGIKAPRRMAFIYIPNGANMADWTPKAAGAEFELPYILEPLKPFHPQFQLLTGLPADKARPNA